MVRNIKLLILLIILFPMLEGCSSFGKGVTEALIENSEKKDKRSCQIWTEGFEGINASIQKHANILRNQGTTKVLMVHGVGHHIPGYATILLEKLSKELDLTVMSKPHKDLTLSSPYDPSKNLGNLRLDRLQSKDRSKELLFYELTWSSITDSEKEVLADDDSGPHSFRRAKANDKLKKFSNDAISDPMIYLGEKQEDMKLTVSESFCWMINHRWSDFPSGIHKPCDLNHPGRFRNAEEDDYIFISHSLGSRITIDALQRLSRLVNEKDFQKLYPGLERLHHTLQNKELTLFMLSNQLPLLQLGRSLPEVLNEHEKYCSPQGRNYAERFSNKIHIVAFNDPNDILSYNIPKGFRDKYLDSRLCATISNISLNVAHVVDIFGVMEIASPFTAHTGYDHDERVVALLVHGLSNKNIPPIIKERCQWFELSR